MQRFFKRIARDYKLQEHHYRLLCCACEAHDRMEQARDLLGTEGITIKTRHGETRVHPAVAIERDARTAFARCLRELGLAPDEESQTPRPPRLSGRYTGRP